MTGRCASEVYNSAVHSDVSAYCWHVKQSRGSYRQPRQPADFVMLTSPSPAQSGIKHHVSLVTSSLEECDVASNLGKDD